jgi:Domain of unknown function (DUF222)
MSEDLAATADRGATTAAGWDIPGIPRPAAEPGGLVAGGREPAGRQSRKARQPAAAGSDTAQAVGLDAAGTLVTGLAAGLPEGEWQPDGPVQALAALTSALDYLAHADPASWPEDVQAGCLRALAAAESRQVAVHARVLAAFSVPGGGLARDGHHSPRTWLTWQTQATRRAAATHVGWMRRLCAHPMLAAALAGASVAPSWARQFAEWSDQLPEDARDTADTELVAAAAHGAGPADLAAIAAGQRREHATCDSDPDDGFDDRAVRIAATFGGAGRIEGDLTARCTAAVDAVLESLAAVRGPEDDRTLAQRRHDALEEACTRLIATDMLPQRAGQPVRLDLEISLDQLTANDRGQACDALIQPMVTGRADHDLLAKLADPGHQAGLAAAMASTATGTRHRLLLEQAIALLSGPAGRAAALRRRMDGGPAIPLSLPLDIPGTLDTIPLHLRRAVRKRDRHCRFPGCDLPPAACDIHHLVHRKDGGRHALTNLTMLCRFHHLVAIHRWGWTLTLHPDGTTTAVSPDGRKTLHSHAPPIRAA